MKEKFFRFIAKNAAFVALFAFLGIIIVGEKAFPQIEEKTDAYFTETIGKAATVFATARTINGAISVFKESSISVTPFGMGTDVALGQVLDPVDDVIERLSDILFSVIISLGIQKIAYEIIGETAVYAAAILLAGSLLINVCFKNGKIRVWSVFLQKAVLTVLFVRIALPCTALLSDCIETHFFAPKIQECQARLSVFESECRIQFSDEDSFKDTAKKIKDLIAEKAKIYWENATNIVGASLEMAGHYIALFLVQVIFLPLGALYLILRLSNLFWKISDKLPEPVNLNGEN